MGLCNLLSKDAFSHRTTLLPETIYFCIKYSIRHQILPSCKHCISIREKKHYTAHSTASVCSFINESQRKKKKPSADCRKPYSFLSLVVQTGEEGKLINTTDTYQNINSSGKNRSGTKQHIYQVEIKESNQTPVDTADNTDNIIAVPISTFIPNV